MSERIEQTIEWLGSRNMVVFLACLLVVLGIWGFASLSDEVKEGDTQRFDDRVSRWMYDHRGPGWVQDAGRDLSAFGGVTGMCLIVSQVCGFLLITRRYRACVVIVVAVAGGVLLSGGLKHVFDRPRPALRPAGVIVYSTSFPSGHSLLSAVTYLTLGGLLARVTPGRRVKLYLVAVAMLMTLLVGVSRVYLCAHYPTDVLAGWTIGLVWAMFCAGMASLLQRKGVVEPERVGR